MAYGQNISTCRSCGQQIVWVRTPNGKNMPCNTALINYVKDPEGKERIVTPEGNVITGRSAGVSANEADGSGYISHFATCPNAARHRRR